MLQGIKPEKMAVNIKHGVVLERVKMAVLIWIGQEIKRVVVE